MHDIAGRRILHRLVLRLLVLVDTQIVVIAHDLLHRHQKGLLRAGAALLRGQIAEPGDDVRDIVLRYRTAFVVQGEAVGAHVVKPHLVRAAVAGLGENQHGGAHASVGLEHAGGHGDDSFQPVAIDDLPADGLVRGGAAEQHAVRHDAGAAPAGFEHLEEQGQEQQLRLFGFAGFEQIGTDDFGVQAALEGWIGQDQAVFLPVRVLVAEAVPVLDEGIFHPVGHHVHGADAQHGAVHVEAGEHAVHVMGLVVPVEEDLRLAVLL